jgi:hypothetical protein
MPDGAMEKLRDELIAAQEGRLDVVKWKLLSIGGIGAVALGLGEGKSAEPALLALVPLLCVYVDLAYWNLSIRMNAIGQYLRQQKDGPFFGYETFATSNFFVFVFEDAAMLALTLVSALFLAKYPYVLPRVTSSSVFVHGAAKWGATVDVVAFLLYLAALGWLSARRRTPAA